MTLTQIKDNDVVLIANRRVIQSLAASIDQKFWPDIALGVVGLEVAAALSAEVEALLHDGVEAPIEPFANVFMPVPRVLYATANPTFAPVPGESDLGLPDRDKLFNRLARYDAVAAGPVVRTIPAETPLVGNPCPIVFRADPNNRFTLLRSDTFSVEQLPDVTVVEDTNDPANSGVAITITGTAYQGDLFSRHHALHAPSHNFSLTLLYGVFFVNDSDINLGPVPFQVTAAPSTPPTQGAPSWPAVGQVLYAYRRPDGGFVLPATGGQIPASPFSGKPDDMIFEKEADTEPRWVVTTAADRPLHYIIEDRAGAAPEVVAEARGGRLVLRFTRATALELTPVNGGQPVSAAKNSAIRNSLIKIHPTLAQAFTCVAGMSDAPPILALLDLLGPSSLDIPLLPRSLVLSTKARIIKASEVSPPGPIGSVTSSVTACDLQAFRYFVENQSFGVSGQIGGTGDSDFTDFSQGADVALGMSGSSEEATFMQSTLLDAADQVRASILKDAPPGFNNNSLQVRSVIEGDEIPGAIPGGIRIVANGHGTMSTPWPLPDIGYDFMAKVRVRFRAQRAVVVDKRKVNGEDATVAVDRFDRTIPESALQGLLLDVGAGRLLLPQKVLGPDIGSPAGNPLSFLAYDDPKDGVACFDCPLPTRIAPPVLDSTGNVVVITDPSIPPADGKADDINRHGQASFDLTPSLRHRWELMPIVPTEDNGDLEVDVSTNPLATFAAFLLSGLAIAFAPVVLPLGGIEVAITVLAATFLLPFANMIASSVATSLVEDKLADQELPSFDPDIGHGSALGLFLENPVVHAPFEFQDGQALIWPGAMIMRFHVVVQAAGLNEAFPEA